MRLLQSVIPIVHDHDVEAQECWSQAVLQVKNLREIKNGKLLRTTLSIMSLPMYSQS
jgi:hypothetical protein